jgi:2-C-methyl-D-erythritol 4-phosphate cytidylyltransferase
VEDAVAIVLAAGLGERMHAEVPKALVAFDGTTIVARAVERALACSSVSGAVVVAPAGWEDAVRTLVEPLGVQSVVTGGATRQASVAAALSSVSTETTRVVCHDAARPLSTAALFDRVVAALDGWDGVVPVLAMVDTVKRVRDGGIQGTEPREVLAIAQTPQAFVVSALRAAHDRAERDGFEATDDAQLLERAGFRVRAIEGERTNMKITCPEDVRLAEALARPTVPGS